MKSSVSAGSARKTCEPKMQLDRLRERLRAVAFGVLLLLVPGQGEAPTRGGRDWGRICQILQKQDLRLREERRPGGGSRRRVPAPETCEGYDASLHPLRRRESLGCPESHYPKAQAGPRGSEQHRASWGVIWDISLRVFVVELVLMGVITIIIPSRHHVALSVSPLARGVS